MNAIAMHDDFGTLDNSAGHLFSYWSGPVSWMERLSIDSAKAVGHDVTVFSYEPEKLARAGLNCTIADARLIMAPLERKMPPPHFSDHFRVEGLGKGCGTWFDLDVLFLRPLPSESHLFGWASAKKINNALLKLPADCPLLAEYLDTCRSGDRYDAPRWYPWYRRVNRRFKGALRQWRGGKPALPIYGPRTLTHLVHKHGLTHLAKARPVFYPIASDKRQIAEMLDWPAKYITPETVCVHLWRSSWKDCHGATVPFWATHALGRLGARRRGVRLRPAPSFPLSASSAA
jgi:hypothetical protein